MEVHARKEKVDKIQEKLDSLSEQSSLAYSLYKVISSKYPGLALRLDKVRIDEPETAEHDLEQLEILSQSESESSEYVGVLLSEI
mmetsp:Transcript_38909/g.59128  ORF Transcript_38909/g.59128 Transcript_38909/m.59128 type:complete len:85 (+) Transcript_38909:588-842(+)